MVRISFKGDLRKAVEKAMRKATGRISTSFAAILPLISDNAANETARSLQDYPVGKFTGQAAESIFAVVRSAKVHHISRPFIDAVDEKVAGGTWKRLQNPVQGPRRSVFGKANIDYPEADNAISKAIADMDWKLKANKSMAIIRAGWPIEYLGLWGENKKTPESYMNSMYQIMIQKMKDIQSMYNYVKK